MKNPLQTSIILISFFLLGNLSVSAEWRWMDTGFPQGKVSFSGTSIGHNVFITSYNDQECTGQIYRSEDFGASWSLLADYLQRTFLTSIVATSNHRLFVMSYNCQTELFELLISDDLGLTWNPAPPLPGISEDYAARFIQISIGFNDQLFITAPMNDYPEVFLSVSNDDAQSWIPLGSISGGFQLSSVKIVSADYLIAGDVAGRIFESFDSGDSWIFSDQLQPAAVEGLMCIPQERCFAGVWSMPLLFSREWNSDEWVLTSMDFQARDFCISSESTVYMATNGVYQSFDYGLTWEEMIVESENASVRRIFQAEDGYLYGIGGKAVVRSAEPVIPPTFTPTAGPGTPTYTPHPPTFTPTPWPSHTPTSTPTPQHPTQPPQPTPACPGLGVTLDHPSGNPVPNSPFYLTARICNPLKFDLTDISLCLLLQIGDSIWYAPGWNTDFDNYSSNWQPGWTDIMVIPEFSWPTSAGSCPEATFWAALVNPTVTAIIGDYDSWAFAW